RPPAATGRDPSPNPPTGRGGPAKRHPLSGNRDIDERRRRSNNFLVLARVLSAALVGVEAALVRVEVDVAPGLPAFTIAGSIVGRRSPWGECRGFRAMWSRRT